MAASPMALYPCTTSATDDFVGLGPTGRKDGPVIGHRLHQSKASVVSSSRFRNIPTVAAMKALPGDDVTEERRYSPSRFSQVPK